MNKKIWIGLTGALCAAAMAASFTPVAMRRTSAKAEGNFFRIDTCDSAWGANPSQKDALYQTYWEGEGAVRTHGGKNMASCFGSIEKTFTLGATGLTEANAALGMFLYVNDVQRITGDAAIEITSSGGCDNGEYQWSLSSLISEKKVRSGWNYLELKVSEAAKNVGNAEPNLDGINFMRIYNHGTNVGMMLDDVILYDHTTYEPTKDTDFVRKFPEKEDFVSGSVLIESCDNGMGTSDTGDKKQGAASGSLSGSGMLIMDHAFPAVDTKIDVYRAELRFDLYLDNVSNFDQTGYNVVEVASGGQCDQDEYEFDLSTLMQLGKITSGWNEVRIPFAATQLFAHDNDMGNKTTGNPDLSKINYVRCLTNGQMRTVKIDNIRIADRDYEEPTTPVLDGNFMRVSHCDEAWGLNPSQSMKKGATYWEGSGAVRSYTGKNNYDNVLSLETGYSPYQTGYVEENAALGMLLYINDVNNVLWNKDAMIEISSSGVCDVDEYQWNLKPLVDDGTLSSGWNYLTLACKDANKSGSPNLDGMNFIRIYMNGTNLLVMVDDVILYDKEEYVPLEDENFTHDIPATDPSAPDYTVLDNCDGDWEGATADKTDKKQGKASVSASGSGQLILSKKISAKNSGLSIYDGVIDFWMYLDNVDSLKNYTGDRYNVIEITSSGGCDANEIELNLTTMILDGRIQNGWNHVVLPLAAALSWQSDNDMINKTTGNPDLTAINYIRFITSGDERTVKLDCVVLRKADYTGEIKCPVAQVLLDGGTAQDGWTADRKEYRYGNSSVYAKGDFLKYTLADLDVGVTELSSVGVSLWAYVDKASALSSWTVTLADSAEKKAVYTVTGLQEGWNWVALKGENAVTEDGFDADAIGGLEIAIAATEEVEIRLNRISLFNAAVSENAEEPTDKVIPPKPEDGFEEDDDGEDYDVSGGKDAGKKPLGGVIAGVSVCGVALVGGVVALAIALVNKKKRKQ